LNNCQFKRNFAYRLFRLNRLSLKFQNIVEQSLEPMDNINLTRYLSLVPKKNHAIVYNSTNFYNNLSQKANCPHSRHNYSYNNIRINRFTNSIRNQILFPDMIYRFWSIHIPEVLIQSYKIHKFISHRYSNLKQNFIDY
jgi:hypothetical protein